MSLRVHSSLGQLVNEQRPAGVHTVAFRATDLPSGVYFYRLIAGDFQQTRKLLLFKCAPSPLSLNAGDFK